MPLRKKLDEKILRSRLTIRTHQPERMREYLGITHNICGFKTGRDPEGFVAQANRAQLERIGLDYCAYDAAVSIDFPATNCYRQFIALFDKGRLRFGQTEAQLSADHSCVVAPEVATTAEYGSGYRHLVLRVDPIALHNKLQALFGVPIKKPLEFHPAANARARDLQLLKNLVLNYARDLDGLGIADSPLVMKELEETLLVAFLRGHPHNYSFLLERPAASATPKQIWMVESFIEANWNLPITIEDIAEITGIPARSIFQAFKEMRGYSPMAFAKNLRLERAREMLLRPERETTVTQVAYRCGFQSHGHFSRDYRERFDELPSQTLMGSRRK